MVWFLLVYLVSLIGCDLEPNQKPEQVVEITARYPVSIDRTQYKKIIAFGDSLTAGFGVDYNDTYPAVLQELVDKACYPYEVVNAGVSGDTSAGGVRRLSWVLEGLEVVVLVLELGANDFLRGLLPSETKKNLNTIIDRTEERGIPVLFTGFSSDEKTGERHVLEFLRVYEDISRERDVSFMPNFLLGVAGETSLVQEDGRHPNAAGTRVVAENVWKFLKPMLPQPDTNALCGS